MLHGCNVITLTLLHIISAYNITRERTKTLSIKNVIEKACTLPKFKDYVRNLYENVKQRFNEYTELIAEKTGESSAHISDDTPLLSFLSGNTII